jgi:hypothetical protein
MKTKNKAALIPVISDIRNLALRGAILLLTIAATVLPFSAAAGESAAALGHYPTTLYKTAKVNGLDIFYREAGPTNAPTIILLHGFPTSSYMFRNLIPALADKYHLIAPDYPGYGHSSMPGVNDFQYTFDNLADTMESLIEQLGIQHYSLYVMDYGAPVGFRIASRHPERVQSLIVQNGNAYVGFLETVQSLLERTFGCKRDCHEHVAPHLGGHPLAIHQWRSTIGND